MSINLDDIQYGDEYQSIDQIKMKNPAMSMDSPKKRPMIDRATKPGARMTSAAAQEYELNCKQLEIWMSDENNLLLLWKRKLNDLSKILMRLDICETEIERKRLQHQEQTIGYEIIQIDDAQNVVMEKIKECYEWIVDYAGEKPPFCASPEDIAQKLDELRAMELECNQIHEKNKKQSEFRMIREQKRRDEEQMREQLAFSKEREHKKALAAAAAASVERARLAREEQEERVIWIHLARSMRWY